jgi:hypothetical protein
VDITKKQNTKADTVKINEQTNYNSEDSNTNNIHA